MSLGSPAQIIPFTRFLGDRILDVREGHADSEFGEDDYGDGRQCLARPGVSVEIRQAPTAARVLHWRRSR